jgi:hypothetical protein
MADALGILLLGCIYGATTCSATCLPTLAPCLPLSNLLVAAGKGGSVRNGIAFGLLYGAALAITPLLIGGIIAQTGRILHTEAQPFIPCLRVLSACLLAILGIRNLM